LRELGRPRSKCRLSQKRYFWRNRGLSPSRHPGRFVAATRRLVREPRKDLPVLLTEALSHAEQATAELRELAQGILPAVLIQGGLRVGVEALASRMPVPVENGVSVSRLPAAIEAIAYFVVAEALTHVAKHARAGRAEVAARIGTARSGSRCVTTASEALGPT
jgi:signal transduction histidine kinase